MSQGERYDQSMRAKNGDLDIITPRSALFTPFMNLALSSLMRNMKTVIKVKQHPNTMR